MGSTHACSCLLFTNKSSCLLITVKSLLLEVTIILLDKLEPHLQCESVVIKNTFNSDSDCAYLGSLGSIIVLFAIAPPKKPISKGAKEPRSQGS
jgi:hypothetical protein